MKLRIQFAKLGFSQFLGHLDMMRYFQKLIRRADIDIKYSAGFSPHQIMTFANPLGLGQTSLAEYMDIEVNSLNGMGSEEIVEVMNRFSVDGINIMDCVLLPDSSENAMASVAAATYLIFDRENISEQGKNSFVSLFAKEEETKKFFEQESIVVLKKSKKSEAKTDIRPLIFDWEFTDCEQFVPSEGTKKALRIFVSAGSAMNLKPDLILETLHGYLGIPYASTDQYQVLRLEMFCNGENGEYKPLLAAGEHFTASSK